ncbi:hypothetical protein ACQKI4_24595, partial [Paenibacillus glucanolyticus]
MQPVLFTNGQLFSPHAASPADSVYVEDGVIRAIGKTAELRLQLAGRDYRTVDWDGGCVLPGLVSGVYNAASTSRDNAGSIRNSSAPLTISPDDP